MEWAIQALVEVNIGADTAGFAAPLPYVQPTSAPHHGDDPTSQPHRRRHLCLVHPSDKVLVILM